MGKLTTEEFIKRAKEVHGNKYDYNKTKYINYDTKVCIICHEKDEDGIEHGEFWQTPANHLKGKGCPFCNGNAKMNTETFIKKAIKKWGDKFDYSKVVYINTNTKVCIIDADGNEFWQRPGNHLSGFDCTKKNEKITTEEFIEKAREVHGDNYDYSKVEYKNAKTKVCIICPEHGEFYQLPGNHLKGNGCPFCAIKKSHEKQKKTTEEFIEKAREVHGDKYDYSKVEYINNETPICITCPKHGDFYQKPYTHLFGCGCKQCARPSYDTNSFIEKAIEVHGNKYNYSKVEYVNNHTKVCIICPEHGEFWQTPANHLNGQGCKYCGRTFRKQETKLFNILKETFKDEEIIHSYYNKNVLGKQEIDIYMPKYKIGIEYQGVQHFKPVDFANYGLKKAKEIFKKNVERDRKKLIICKKNDIRLFYYSNIESENTFLNKKIYHDYDELISMINQIIKKENEK